jgi:putative heme-binding domain-containing protein
MPGAWQLSEREVASVAAFVRSLGVLPPEAVPGDPARGASQYRARGCPGCHIMNGEGRAYGPELTSIGARRSAAHLREALLRPAAFIPDDFSVAELETATGTVIRGIICNEDTFSIQLKDSAGRYHSVRKSVLKSLKKPAGESAMPAYDRLPRGDVDDIVAFLASSKGRP